MSRASRSLRVAEFRMRLNTLGFETYVAYLASEHWADVRRRYWESRLPKCCHGCGASSRPLDLHHRTYKRLGGEYLTDLILVCRNCHRDIHQYEQKTSVHMWRSTNRVLRKKRKEARRKIAS